MIGRQKQLFAPIGCGVAICFLPGYYAESELSGCILAGRKPVVHFLATKSLVDRQILAGIRKVLQPFLRVVFLAMSVLMLLGAWPGEFWPH